MIDEKNDINSVMSGSRVSFSTKKMTIRFNPYEKVGLKTNDKAKLQKKDSEFKMIKDKHPQY